MKKYLILIVLFSFFLSGCRKVDSILFKEDYEKLNDVSGYTKVSIPSDNPFIPITDSKLVEKIEKKEDIIIFFGSSKENEARNVVDLLLKTSKELEIKEIYYLDLDSIRDTKEVNESLDIITVTKGSDSYNKLIELLGEYLEEYIVDQKVVGKRIYIPSVLLIKNKKIENILNLKEVSKEQLSDYLEKFNLNSCSMNEEGC